MTGSQRGIFVTGTDTGVGKTVVSACLVSSLGHGVLEAGADRPFQ